MMHRMKGLFRILQLSKKLSWTGQQNPLCSQLLQSRLKTNAVLAFLIIGGVQNSILADWANVGLAYFDSAILLVNLTHSRNCFRC